MFSSCYERNEISLCKNTWTYSMLLVHSIDPFCGESAVKIMNFIYSSSLRSITYKTWWWSGSMTLLSDITSSLEWIKINLMTLVLKNFSSKSQHVLPTQAMWLLTDWHSPCLHLSHAVNTENAINHMLHTPFWLPMSQWMQNPTLWLSSNSQTLISAQCCRRWSNQTYLPAGVLPIANNRRPLQTWPRRRKHCPVSAGINQVSLLNPMLNALSPPATLRHPAGLQNHTMLFPCSCASVFIFTEGVWGQFEFWLFVCAYFGCCSVSGSCCKPSFSAVSHQ